MRSSFLYLATILVCYSPIFAIDTRPNENENSGFCEDQVLTVIKAWGNVDPRGLINIDTPPSSELLSFAARKLKEGIEITWETGKETSLDYFDLHRSIDGKDYESIYQVKAAGTTEQKSVYQYLDDQVYEVAKDATQVNYQLYQVGLNEEEENLGGTALLLTSDPIANISPQVTPKSPNVAAMQRFGNFPVNYYTGLAKIEIPIYEIELGDMIIPVKLQYHSGGNKVSDNASWVGLGWRLSCEYSITREVRGIKDEGNTILLGDNLPPNYAQSCLTTTTKPLITALLNNEEDGERDIFSYHTPLKNNTFILTPGVVRFQEADKTKISYTATSQDIGSFTLRDENGHVFKYQDFESSTLPGIDGITAWHLKEIQTNIPNQKAVFNYFDNGLHEYTYGRYDFETYNYELENNPGVDPGLANSNPGGTAPGASITSRLLDEIYFPNGKITFVRGGDRTDGFGKRLDVIEVRAYNHTSGNYDLLKKYKLWHSDKTRTGTSDKVMFLDSVQVLDTDGLRLGSYKMTYNSTALPSRTSAAQDFYGYFNNKTSNTNLIPRDTVPLSYYIGHNPTDVYVGGATGVRMKRPCRPGSLIN